MSSRYYFVTGLPRSRTAWIANLLTWGDSFCFHEALFDCGTMADFKKIMAGPRLTRYVGDADPNLGFIPQSILESFPSCRIVFVHRDLDECVESEFNALNWEHVPGCDDVTKDRLKAEFKQVSMGISHLWKNLRDDRKLMVPYKLLEEEGMIREIWNFCLPNTPFPKVRYEMLRDLKVTQLMANRYKRNPSLPFNKLVQNATVLENRTAECCGA